MTGFDEFTMSLITNEAILAMHADARFSHPVWRRDVDGTEHAVWMAAGAKGGIYVAVFNLGEKDSMISVSLADMELEGEFEGKELWSGEAVEIKETLKVSLSSHGAKAFFIS